MKAQQNHYATNGIQGGQKTTNFAFKITPLEVVISFLQP